MVGEGAGGRVVVTKRKREDGVKYDITRRSAVLCASNSDNLFACVKRPLPVSFPLNVLMPRGGGGLHLI